MKKYAVIFYTYRIAVYILFALGCISLNYFTNRSHFLLLIGLYTCLFICYAGFISFCKTSQLITEAKWLAILIRILLLFSIPNLSDDFHRFFWDGLLLSHGENPYLLTPYVVMQNNFFSMEIKGLNKELYSQLNSKLYFSVYPPICQYLGSIAAQIAGKSELYFVFILKLFVLFFEIGTIYFIGKICSLQKVKPNAILIYALNPLIIIELIGNIHFEVVMLFFIAASLYLMLTKKIIVSAIVFGLAVATKFLPLLILPFLIKQIGFIKTMQYSILSILTALLLYLPFYDPLIIQNISASLQLYFTNFEFNASAYYLLKSIISSQNEQLKILVQQLLPIVVFILVLSLSAVYQPAHFFKALLLAFTVYFLCATTVHPWYLSTLVFISLFTSHKFGLVWSFLVCLSYYTYTTEAFKENYILIIVEYLIVLIYLLVELGSFKNKLKLTTK